MTISPAYVVAIAIGVAAYLSAIYWTDRALAGPSKIPFRYFVAGVTIAGWFIAVGGIDLGPLHWPGLVAKGVMDRARSVDITKALLAIAAAGAVFYEQHRVAQRRPIAERWKRFVGIALGLTAIVTYFDGFKPGYPKFYHRHDQYHYYLGSKYFHELGYDGLYKCTVIAEDELGTVTFQDEDHIGSGRMKLDLSKEVRHPDWKIRNLGGDNLLMPVTDVLAHPEVCKSAFSPERWEAYKADILYFRLASDKKYWEGFQHDHGYNPPPVWTMGGWAVASLFPAGRLFMLPVIGKVSWLQCLGSIDVFLTAGMFAAIFWAFGWRVFAVAAIFWGTQASAPILWTYGAFLRQDWIFWLVLSVCFARKRYFALSGAAMVYAGLLRVFPGIVVVGWLVVVGFQLVKHKNLTKPQWRMLLGGTLAAALLIPASVKVAGANSYKEFYRHTLEVHDRTPLTNHMGLRVLVAQKLPFEIQPLGIGTGPSSGRMKYTKDDKLTDPFDMWKRMRNERYAKFKIVAYALVALSLVYFAFVARRIRSMWMAACLAQVFIILMSQLTSYYYVFMILLAPLTKAKRSLEAPIFGFAALSQFVFIIFYWNDDKYWALTAISLVFCYGVLCAFLPQAERERILRYFGRGKAAPAK
ncbi:Hypothetical protein A7982_00939 [Minicystis rosea]|nr:Hypothetical protein A7982_00939 [Minicystis rosea]